MSFEIYAPRARGEHLRPGHRPLPDSYGRCSCMSAAPAPARDAGRASSGSGTPTGNRFLTRRRG